MRINDRKIFDVYVQSLMEQAKKKKPDADGDGVPDWADKHPGKDDKESKGDKKSMSKGKLNKLPPGLRKYMQKKSGKKMVKEDHEKYSEETKETKLYDLLKMLRDKDMDLYHKLEEFIEENLEKEESEESEENGEEKDSEENNSEENGEEKEES